MIYRFRKEMLEDAKGMTRNHKSKNRQNDQKKNNKKTTNGLQNTTQKTND
jgi:hypothetical protein